MELGFPEREESVREREGGRERNKCHCEKRKQEKPLHLYVCEN